MKRIEKLTNDGDTQVFEQFTPKKEAIGYIKDVLFSIDDNNIFKGEDDVIILFTEDSEIVIGDGDEVPKIAYSKIKKVIYHNASSVMFFGNFDIVQNEKYGDWEINY